MGIALLTWFSDATNQAYNISVDRETFHQTDFIQKAFSFFLWGII